MIENLEHRLQRVVDEIATRDPGARERLDCLVGTTLYKQTCEEGNLEEESVEL